MISAVKRAPESRANPLYLTFSVYNHLKATRQEGFALGGHDTSIHVRDFTNAMGEGDWPWADGDGPQPPIPFWEAPGSNTSKPPSQAALNLDTPLNKVQFVKSGQLPLPRPLSDFDDWLEHPIRNIPIPTEDQLHPKLSTENDVVDYRALLLNQILIPLYNRHRVLPGTKLRPQRDNNSASNPVRADMSAELYYDNSAAAKSFQPCPHYQGTEQDFLRLKQHLLTKTKAHRDLFMWAAEVKPDRVIVEYLDAMIELAHFDERWPGLPAPPASLRPILLSGDLHDRAAYDPASSRAASRAARASHYQRAAAIWAQVLPLAFPQKLCSSRTSQAHAYLVERDTPYGMIISTNMYFLLMLKPEDPSTLLVDGPYWRRSFSDPSTIAQWDAEDLWRKTHDPTAKAYTQPWRKGGDLLERMKNAGYGGVSTCAGIIRFALHALLVCISLVPVSQS